MIPLRPRRRMRTNHKAIAEFERIRTKLTRLVDWLGINVPRKHCTIFVDTADLRARCGAITQVIDALVSTPRKRSNRELIRKRVLTLFTEVDNLDMYTEHLKGPLEYLHSTFYRTPKKSKGKRGQAPNRRMQATAGGSGDSGQSRRASARRA